MKKFGILFMALAVSAGDTLAEPDDVQLGGSVKNTAVITNSYVVRGEVAGILFTLPTAMTCTVAVTSSEGTIYSGTVGGGAGNTHYLLRYPAYSSAGAVLSTNVVYAPLTIASKVSAVITGVLPASGTNAVVVQLNVNK
jgi:hypothetical protein